MYSVWFVFSRPLPSEPCTDINYDGDSEDSLQLEQTKTKDPNTESTETDDDVEASDKEKDDTEQEKPRIFIHRLLLLYSTIYLIWTP